MQFEGIYTPVVTPYHHDFTLNEAALAETGRRFLHYAADSNLKKVLLECGGKNPAIVLEDAENLDHVSSHVVNAAFWNMGENCSAASRLIAYKAVKAPLTNKTGARLRDWKTGDPLDPANHLGALIDADHCIKVPSYLKNGDRTDGPFVTPKVYEISKDDKLARDEVLGPILSVIEVASTDEAIQLANDTAFGLTASVFTANTRSRAGAKVDGETIYLNRHHVREPIATIPESFTYHARNPANNLRATPSSSR